MTIIRFDRVSKHYDAFQVLKDIDFSVAKGERVVVCGPSGSGKSTLIRCINGLESIGSGTLTVDGIAVSDKTLPKVRARVGMVFQQFNLFP
ncbi:MAG: amino acid ABC transporter ATP-binding protein, partial [Pseudooceanicola sp.]|nr:amino acid ABC transporter ATP-binding protein [Pseudooceanicola sp.]